MALGAVVLGALASLLGLGMSLWQDTPAGPSIVTVAALIFAGAAVFGAIRR
jgi:zinc transport system permease protein